MIWKISTVLLKFNKFVLILFIYFMKFYLVLLVFSFKFKVLLKIADRTSQTVHNEMVTQSQQNVALPPSQSIATNGDTVSSHNAMEYESKYFSLEIIREATKDFDIIDLLGKDVFGSVYKGQLQDGT